jgi:hypothetical protein
MVQLLLRNPLRTLTIIVLAAIVFFICTAASLEALGNPRRASQVAWAGKTVNSYHDQSFIPWNKRARNIQWIQRSLNVISLDSMGQTIAVNGKLDADTRLAIVAFKKGEGMPANDGISWQFVRALQDKLRQGHVKTIKASVFKR